MNDSLLLGLWRYLVPIPRTIWRGQVSKGGLGNVARLAFMSEEHHMVRDFVVRELPRAGKPLSPESISQALGLSPGRVVALLDDLERNKTFLFRNEEGSVAWAYPVTVDRTPHHVTFSSGEQVYAA